MRKHKDLSLASKGLKYKLKISFYLMSILPLLVCIYLVSNYILPQIGFKMDIVASILISIFIAVVGLYVIKEVFDRILSVTSEAKLIAAGDVSRMVDVSREDEVGDLGDSLNQLTQRIRSNMDELKSYSEKTTEINIEIQKRVFVLSNLLQISSLITQGSGLDSIIRLTIERVRLLANSDIAYILFKDENADTFSMNVYDGMNSDYLSKIKVIPQESVFDKLVKTYKPLILDEENLLPENLSAGFYEQFKLKNTLALPVTLRGRVIGIVGIGNNQVSFLYKKDDIELLDIFAKQVTIAVENDRLMHKVEKLEIKDALTGLYNQAFIRSSLKAEIKRAITYHRPCSFILVEVDNFQEFQCNFGALQTEAALKKVAYLIKESVTELDHVGRFGDHTFAIILPEKTKRQTKEISEEIRKKIEFAFGEEEDVKKRFTVSGAVTENPLDGVEPEQLINKAEELAGLAKKQGKNKILS